MIGELLNILWKKLFESEMIRKVLFFMWHGLRSSVWVIPFIIVGFMAWNAFFIVYYERIEDFFWTHAFMEYFWNFSQNMYASHMATIINSMFYLVFFILGMIMWRVNVKLSRHRDTIRNLYLQRKIRSANMKIKTLVRLINSSINYSKDIIIIIDDNFEIKFVNMQFLLYSAQNKLDMENPLGLSFFSAFWNFDGIRCQILNCYETYGTKEFVMAGHAFCVRPIGNGKIDHLIIRVVRPTE